LISRNISVIVFAFAALNFSFFFLNRLHDYSYPYFAFVGYTTFAMLFAILVDDCVINENGWAARICNIPPLKFFGKISYGFYIIHWPVYKLVNDELTAWLNTSLIQNEYYAQIAGATFSTGLAIALSVLSYHFFEARFLRLKNTLPGLK
jgi:peptidoglycan/LPS O-acetylase OafA/YrhL